MGKIGLKDLTPSQVELRNYLLLHFREGQYISKKEISNALGYQWNEYSNRNGIEIERDIQAINDNLDYDYVIISNSKGYKIATEEEAINYLKNEYDSIMRKLKRHFIKCKKIRKNNQLQFNDDFKTKVIQTAVMGKDYYENN